MRALSGLAPRRSPRARRACVAAALLPVAIATCASRAAGASAPPGCSPGAHKLSSHGARMYPETGNGGYTSLHTDVEMFYEPAADEFLSGNHVVLTDRASQCLTSLSLDFERTSGNAKAGPDMTVGSVLVDGQPAGFTFVQPTYPGDPAGEGDPDPRAHEASQTDPVGGPEGNPLPPACSPELRDENANPDSQDGRQCPADKLVVTPSAPIPAGSTFSVSVSYTGRPGVHDDGDGSEEGWFRTHDGSLVSTEPVGSEDWMPLNDYPTAKPTYDFYETVPAGEVAVANGELASVTELPADSEFPGGAVRWDWVSSAPIASYLVQSSIGHYELSSRTGADGIVFYEAQDESIEPSLQARNLRIMNMQEAITEYESRFSGPYPFSSDGSLIGTASVDSGEEEMQTMISFNEGHIELPVLWHENMHQWWGDNVTEAGYGMTFYKEGLADWIERYVFPARRLQGRAFESALAGTFDATYASAGRFWTIAPSDPFPYSLFDNAPTYARPAAAYEALRRILGASRFAAVLSQIQRDYGGANIDEQQLEAAFAQWLPEPTPACQARLVAFFAEWFDTAYAPGGGAQRPRITGPGLAGAEFFGARSGCPAPAGGSS